MKRTRYNPRDIKTFEINRFRGVADDDRHHNMPKPYVGSSENLESTKIRQLDCRGGHVDDAVVTDGSYTDGVNTGKRLIVGSVLGEGTSLWASVRAIFAKKYVADYDPPVVVGPPVLPPIPPPPDTPEIPPLPPPLQPPPPLVPPVIVPPEGVDLTIFIDPEEFSFIVAEGYSAT